jgi:hypothetical protein
MKSRGFVFPFPYFSSGNENSNLEMKKSITMHARYKPKSHTIAIEKCMIINSMFDRIYILKIDKL